MCVFSPADLCVCFFSVLPSRLLCILSGKKGKRRWLLVVVVVVVISRGGVRVCYRLVSLLVRRTQRLRQRRGVVVCRLLHRHRLPLLLFLLQLLLLLVRIDDRV